MCELMIIKEPPFYSDTSTVIPFAVKVGEVYENI